MSLTKKLIPIVVLGVLLGAAALILRNPPEASRRGAPPAGASLTVDAAQVERTHYTVWLDSYGTVQPRTQTTLVSQVGGQITEISPSFRPGGAFSAGEVLVTVDPRDYEVAVKVAEANLIDARRAVVEAEAQSDQARADWEKLQRPGEPSPLVLKLPQLDAARARLISAEANLDMARLDLERTRIKAPYDGRVREQLVDLGQVIGANTQLARVYASDVLEVRLPLRHRDLRFAHLPEEQGGAQPAFLRSSLDETQDWRAELVRTESALDDSSRLLHVVAQVDPDLVSAPRIGEYVTARIRGVTVPDAVVIPSTAIYQGTFVYLVEDGRLARREVTIGWQSDTDALIDDGLDAGELLVLTPLGQVTSGMPVTLARDRRDVERRGDAEREARAAP